VAEETATNLILANIDTPEIVLVPVATTDTEALTATAHIHHIDGNLRDVRSCHHAGIRLLIDTKIMNANLSVRETGSDGTGIRDDRCSVMVRNGAAGE